MRGTVEILYRPGHPLNRFDPRSALGAALDGHQQGWAATAFTAHNVSEMRGAGLRALTYRLRTELAGEAWHWNPVGRWSDSAHARGYWTSSERSAGPLRATYGYRLPRRGNTIDQANDDGYSRLDDGDSNTFWKSNPYLDRRSTGHPPLGPQWIVVDLGRRTGVNGIRIRWGAPYARSYAVEYWDGVESSPFTARPAPHWRIFPLGDVTDNRGGSDVRRLATAPHTVRYVRLLLRAGSGTAHPGSTDPRDSVGYAVRELEIGLLDRRGGLRDAVRHARSNARQSVIAVSSTDPWHRAIDRDERVEQAGFDQVYASGLTNGQPMMVPVGVLYDTPDNAAGALRYLRSRHYAVDRIEMGEEADGQLVTPEDYGELYLQFARALHAVDPTVRLGGPGWQNADNQALALWPPRPPTGVRSSWIGRLLDLLDSRGRAADFTFFSFEWYPFDDACSPTRPALAAAPALLAERYAALRRSGLPDSIPRMITEYGYSAFAGETMVRVEGALFNVDAAAHFLALGGSAAYQYGYEPDQVIRERCPAWGNNMMLLADSRGQAAYRLPTYYGARLLTHAWTDSAGGPHELFDALLVAPDAGRAAALVSRYAVRRPDGRWGVLLVNRDPLRTWALTIRLRQGTASTPLAGPLQVWRYSRRQYAWHGAGARGRPGRSQPPTHEQEGRGGGPLRLEPYSIMVVLEGGRPD